jgi:hypothetical protein
MARAPREIEWAHFKLEITSELGVLVGLRGPTSGKQM